MELAIKEKWHLIQEEINGDSEEEQTRIRDLFNAFDPECADSDHKERKYGNIILSGAAEYIFDGDRNSIWFLETNSDDVKEALIALMEEEGLIFIDEPEEKKK